ncbi:ADP-ribosylglycohydrolase family protein [Flavobacterium sp.]|uniref:ADP-ribosylglycohydrolase family protein n=1 Tax=Flavobacterium sp. TaxID=239 RepID=UPI003D0E700F
MKSKIHSALFGVAIGDALGVPVEFKDRDELKRFPVTGMREYGSHGQPAGTWSDDSSLTFCLADSLCNGYDTNQIGQYFVNWANGQMWTPHGRVFDIGMATGFTIHQIEKGTPPLLAGGTSERDNGNGSLMRILPLVFFIKDMPIEKRFDITKDVSSLTHRHIRSVLACFIYLEYARLLIEGKSKEAALVIMQETVKDFLNNNAIASQKEIELYHRVLDIKVGIYEKQLIHQLEESEIASSGYVLHSLEASIWCVLTSSSYSETVLKAVNLGGDTDTTAAIAGGLAGLIYGYEAIPKDWLEVLARKNDIEKLCNRMAERYSIDKKT